MRRLGMPYLTRSVPVPTQTRSSIGQAQHPARRSSASNQCGICGDLHHRNNHDLATTTEVPRFIALLICTQRRARRSSRAGDANSLAVLLLVADLFHPIDHFAVQRLLDGDMHRCRGRRRSMPVLLTGWKPNDITGPDFLDWATLTLRPTAAVCDN